MEDSQGIRQMDTTSQILQKVHLIVTGVPIDGAVRDIFAARVAKEGWGFVATIVDDYLNVLAKTGSVEGTLNAPRCSRDRQGITKAADSGSTAVGTEKVGGSPGFRGVTPAVASRTPSSVALRLRK